MAVKPARAWAAFVRGFAVGGKNHVALYAAAVTAVLSLAFGGYLIFASEQNAVTGRDQGTTLDICPTNYGSFPEDAPPLTCGCDAASVKRGSVYGANPYRYLSSLCRAALNAGAIGTEGGKILVKPEKAEFFPAVLRNGVETSSISGGMGFSVSSTADGRRSASPVFDGRTLDVCPTNYGSFPEDAPLCLLKTPKR